MAGTDHNYNMQFEAQVRQVAEAIWSLPAGQCQPSHYPNDAHIRELDGIARLRDVSHLIMVTTSTRLDKAKADVLKLNAAEAHEEKTAMRVSKWFITEKQLDAQHIDFARKNKVTPLTLEQFRRRFFDGSRYIALRRMAAFGSARDLHSDSITIDDSKYVQLPVTLLDDKPVSRPLKYANNKESSVDEIVECVRSGGIAVLIAPFGSGKSITTRQVFLRLAEQYNKNDEIPVPLVLNLREHWGQSYADEILDRHARSIGYEPRQDLTVAWRAGLAHLLVDGFDEVASQGVIRKDDKNFMREARREALSGVRDFVNKIPNGVGVLLCGRDHYFDDEIEISSALSIGGKKCKIFKLGEFTEAGVAEFLTKNGINQKLPDWLPRKPLLISYLIQKDLVNDIIAIDSSSGFPHAWDTFLRKITEREAMLESSTMEAQTLRSVMERLAFLVRERSSGTGPITGTDLSSAFQQETGQSAGEGVLAQLQRLPGLTERDQDPGARSFVDEDMLSALQGSAFYRLIIDNFKNDTAKPIAELKPKAVTMASYLLAKAGFNSSTMLSLAKNLSRSKSGISVSDQTLSDLMVVSLFMATEEGLSFVNFNGIEIGPSVIGRLSLEDMSIKGISFKDCIISEVILSPTSLGGEVSFHNCMLGQVGGVADTSGLPPEVFYSCDIGRFDQLSTTTAVLQSSLSPAMKALVTILRKLYKQAGGGRQKNALHRGITQPAVSEHIERVIQILEIDGFVFTTGDVLHPVRKNASRVDAILVAPSLSVDPVVLKIRAI